MHARKRIFAFLFAALAMLLCTACGKWDYSREAVKAANQAQNTVTFKEDTKLAQSLWDALNASAQPIAIEAALKADENLKSLLTDGYSLDILIASSDDAEAAAAAIADLLTVAGRTSAGHLAMVKSPSGLYYAAALTYRTASGGSGSDSDDDNNSNTKPDDSDNPTPDSDQWEKKINTNGTIELIAPASLTGILTEAQVDAVISEKEKSNLIRVDLSNTQIHTIGKETFDGCTSLIQVELSNTVKTVADGAFLHCENLFTINLDRVTTINANAFYGCARLEEINLSNATEIGNSAFNGCTLLEKVEFGKSDVKIGESAFYTCSNLSTNKIDLSGVVSIGAQAFMGCNPLHAKLGDGLTFVGNFAFDSETTIYYGSSAEVAAERFKDVIEKDYITCKFDSAEAWNKLTLFSETNNRLARTILNLF